MHIGTTAAKPKVLVTGSTGGLGSEVVARLSADADAPCVVALNHSDLDITDAGAVDSIIANGNFDFVVNCAAYTAVDRAESEPDRCHAVNVTGVRNLATALQRHEAHRPCRLIHISTDYVFDGTKRHPWIETDSPHPLSVYGRSKLESEKVITESGIDAVIIRTGWLYSAHGHSFVRTILENALQGRALRVVNDQFGTPTYAADLADAIARVLAARGTFPGGIYHYAGEGECTWFEFAAKILDMTGIDIPLTSCATDGYPTPAKRPPYSVLDKTKIKAHLGIDLPNWTDALGRMLTAIGMTKQQ